MIESISTIESVVIGENGESLRSLPVETPPLVRVCETIGTSEGTRLDAILADYERQVILTALRDADGTRSLAARRLGISRSRLYRRLDALGIEQEAAKA